MLGMLRIIIIIIIITRGFQRIHCAKATSQSRCRLGHHQTKPAAYSLSEARHGVWAGYGRNKAEMGTVTNGCCNGNSLIRA